MRLITPITSPVVVQGRYLVDGKKRFLIKGIAFPVAVNHDTTYHEEGWIGILEQLRAASLELNTLRLYELNPLNDYSGFFQAAADLGFYLIVPLTSSIGDGVLDRTLPAPSCYSRKLFNYGVQVIDIVKSYPNILGGVLGNEVMNTVDAWKAAPCVLAYARDLKLHFNETFTLIYTTQHASIVPAETAATTVQLTLDYINACGSNNTVDILGINIESWCSSTQSFEVNEDGTIGAYLDLYQHLENATIPLFFSEVGCSLNLFNRDNGLDQRARDWNQLPVILGGKMMNEWSGFVAYTYDGPKDFSMTTGGPWDGIHVLNFTTEMNNFFHQLKNSTSKLGSLGMMTQHKPTVDGPMCSLVTEALSRCCKLDLVPLDSMPSYCTPNGLTQQFHKLQVDAFENPVNTLIVAFIFIYIVVSLAKSMSACRDQAVAPSTSSESALNGVSYAKNYNTFGD